MSDIHIIGTLSRKIPSKRRLYIILDLGILCRWLENSQMKIKKI